jgi:hypothetical protein
MLLTSVLLALAAAPQKGSAPSAPPQEPASHVPSCPV